MAAYPKITTFPPLGQATVIPLDQDKIPFTLVVEWNLARPSYSFEFLLCYTTAGSSTQHESLWPTSSLAQIDTKNVHILDAEDCRRSVFKGSLSRDDLTAQHAQESSSRHFLFTVKYRVDRLAPWQLVSLSDGITPGELILQETAYGEPLQLLDLDVGWKASSLNEETHSSSGRTYLLESTQPIATSTSDGNLSVQPLVSLPSAVRYFSLVRLQPYWLGCRQGKGSFFHVNEDAIVTSFLLKNGTIITFVVLGWIDDVYQVFRSDDQGRLVVGAQNDNGDDRSYRIIMSSGHSFEDTLETAMNQVRNLVAKSNKISDLENKTNKVLSSIDLKAAAVSTERWLDNLAFCTWNALGQDLTEHKIMRALEQLKENKINISTLLIDDNWQSLGPTRYDYSEPFYRGWSDMEANPNVAPTGLKDLVSKVYKQYPSIKDIGVWHALMGYWGGLSSTGSIAKQYPTADIDALLMGNTPAIITTIAASSLHKFYQDFYSFLKSCGITFVKTDVQHMLSVYTHAADRCNFISTYQSAWTTAQLTHFEGKAISCMSQTPQTLFHSLLLPENTPAILQRNSDDFYPEIPASHPWHIWTNAHNAHFTRHLNVVPDWDMFQTSHEYSAYHAAARCLSGGPVLITDVPGEHDVGLIGEMTATSPDDEARSIALRTGKGVSTRVFDLYTEEGVVLKIIANADMDTKGNKTSTRHKAEGVAGVLMGLFNISERETRCMIDVEDFGWQAHAHAHASVAQPPPGTTTTTVNEVLVRGHRTREIFGPIEISRNGVTSSGTETGTGSREAAGSVAPPPQTLIHTRLPVRGYDILTAHPVRCISTASGPAKICVLGLLGKMSGAAAITNLDVFVDNDNDKKLHVVVDLKAVGVLGIWVDGGGDVTRRDRVQIRVQGSRVDDAFLTLATSAEYHHQNHDKAKREAGDVSMPGYIWQIDVEGFWAREKLWDRKYDRAVVELVAG